MLRYDELKDTLDRMIRRRPILGEGLPGLALALLREATVIRLGREHVPVLTRTPGVPPVGWQVLHPVFPCIHVELDGGFVCDRKEIWNLTIFAGKTDGLDGAMTYAMVGMAFGTDLDDADHPSIFNLPTFFYDADGRPTHHEGGSRWTPIHGLLGMTVGMADRSPWSPLNGVVRNILDFLALPSVRLPIEPGIAKINRTRKKKHKPPLTDYHIVNWSEGSPPDAFPGATGGTHRVRYDVRGHWAMFARGVLAGRRIWRRTHQRGPVEAPFRPKGYHR